MSTGYFWLTDSIYRLCLLTVFVLQKNPHTTQHHNSLIRSALLSTGVLGRALGEHLGSYFLAFISSYSSREMILGKSRHTYAFLYLSMDFLGTTIRNSGSEKPLRS